MSAVDDKAPPLTDEQQRVVGQPVDALTLVTAGPGAGKTHTLLRRLERLADEEDLHAGEVLVLTFSRAAVRDLRERLARQGRHARFIRAQTFDSWALDLLMRIDPEGEWEIRSFDQRIEAARRLIEEGRGGEQYGEGLRHVIIDEVQDLVGARRELVQALLAEFDCGFTVVGDPAQSIYGFTLGDDRPAAGETGRFFAWLREEFAEDLNELSLTHNFRARTQDVRTALGHGRTLQDPGNGDSTMERRLYAMVRDSLRSTMGFGDLDEWGLRALREYPYTTALLCRYNSQALLLSELLWAGGVTHRLRRSAQDRAAPGWLAPLLRRVEGPVLSQRRFEELLPEAVPAPGSDPGAMWRLLRRVGGRGDDVRAVEMYRLRQALHTGRLPDELVAEPEARVVVSTVHRAKGLEFDRVIVVDPGEVRSPVDDQRVTSSRRRRSVDLAEEARLLYVAMTRARDDLMYMPPSKFDGGLCGIDPETARWYRTGYSRGNTKGKPRRLGVEVAGQDLYTDLPAGTRDFDASPTELQEYLAREVASGDAVTLERVGETSELDGFAPPYLLIHQERPIAAVSARFRDDLSRLLAYSKGRRPGTWPKTLTELRVDAVVSVAGDQAAGRRAGLGEHGLWLAPRIVGLSRFDWGRG